MTDAESSPTAPIFENAKRLIDDYILLKEAGRVKSAILLQFFAMEEIGKIFLIERGLYQGSLLHKRKQLAVASLSCGYKVMEHLQDKLTTLGIDGPAPSGWKEMDDLELVRSFGEGKLYEYISGEGGQELNNLFKHWERYVASASMGLFEYFRQISAYCDLDPKKPSFVPIPITSDDLARGWFSEGTSILANALRGMADPAAKNLATRIYKGYLKTFVK